MCGGLARIGTIGVLGCSRSHRVAAATAAAAAAAVAAAVAALAAALAAAFAAPIVDRGEHVQALESASWRAVAGWW